MIEELKSAGFVGVESEGGIIHARLWASSAEFTATPEGADWRLALQWPVRADDAQRDRWNATHPDTPLDIHLGETRLTFVISDGDVLGLHHWAMRAEEAVAQLIRWRRDQRAPGEGY